MQLGRAEILTARHVTATRTRLATLVGHKENVNHVDFSPDGKIVMSWGSDGTMLWNVSTRARITIPNKQVGASDVAISPDWKILATKSADNTVMLKDTASQARIAALERPMDDVHYFVFSPDGKTLAAASRETVMLWNTATGARIAALKAHKNDVGYIRLLTVPIAAVRCSELQRRLRPNRSHSACSV